MTEPDKTPIHPHVALALAHARPVDRPLWEGLFALDRRLGETGARATQPLLIQIRLAWWRDRFAEPASAWPRGEPLLAMLAGWDAERAALVALVDAWEGDLLGEGAAGALETARIGALVALGRLAGCDAGHAIAQAAREWLDPAAARGAAPRLPRAMRPLAVRRALALREAGGRKGGRLGDIGLLLRLALFGR